MQTPLPFSSLFEHTGLSKLDHMFLDDLNQNSPDLAATLAIYRSKPTETTGLSKIELSEFLIALAEQVENFLVNFFGIEQEYTALKKQLLIYNPIGIFKKNFILTKVKKALHKPENIIDQYSFAEYHHWLLNELNTANIKNQNNDLETDIANFYLMIKNQETPEEKENFEKLILWCALAYLTPEGQEIIKHWHSFKFPNKTDFSQLVNSTPTQVKQRDGFELTDKRWSSKTAQTEIHYCIFCHDHEGDLCSKGFPENKKDESNKNFKKNPLDITLTGCPLEEKISEMQWLKREGFSLGALAMVMVDNPMCPATGHRICNDCMKSCIYQKLTPVNIPEIETRVLTDILDLPWGVEIYDLLTRWNPLRHDQWIQKPYNNKKIMIAGMGPAGFTLAHHLLQEGCAVVGFDGLKIEPLNQHYINKPIKYFSEITESLDDRVVSGFGGVAEYGITVRWDKNFLKLIYITLMRRRYFQVFGNTRFGGTIKIEDAWELGFDHFAIAVGAGLPKALPIKNSLAPGMRQANDFLMALQLTGAAKKNNLANLQVRLPAIVIGGGLTGVDAATEVQAYYIRQVEKIAERYSQLDNFELDPQDPSTQESQEILNEFLLHADLIQQERELARTEKRPPNFTKLIHAWGGVSIVYRKTMQESPAYINNHEELQKALEEGLFYLENLSPTEVILDQYGYSKAVKFADRENPEKITELNAKCILVATGASLNVAYAFEHPETFERKKMEYQRFEEQDNELIMPGASAHCKEPDFGPFTSYQKDQYRVSFLGDTHPVFHGNVVKAIASAKATYPKIMQHLAKPEFNKTQPTQNTYESFKQKIQQQFDSTVVNAKQIKKNVLELTIHAPQAIKHYRPGQFYRAQPYESDSHIINNTSTATEAIALFANKVDKENNLITLTILQNGASAKLFSHIKPKQKLALMGPAGVRSKVSEHHETVLIIGNQLGLVQLQSYGAALKQAQNRVVFLGYLDHPDQIFHQKEIEALADLVIWAIKPKNPANQSNLNNKLKLTNQNHISLNSNCLDALTQYATQAFDSTILFSEIDRIQILGDPELLKNISHLFKHELKNTLSKQPKLFGSVHSSMQCMLKGVCAQCLQWQIDPETGERKKAVFACSWQDQPLELIDFDNLAERQRQNKLQEKLHSAYVDKFMT